MSKSALAKAIGKEVGKNADYIYNGVMRVASACKEDFDLIQLAEKYPPALQKEYEQENKIRWALELAIH